MQAKNNILNILIAYPLDNDAIIMDKIQSQLASDPDIKFHVFPLDKLQDIASYPHRNEITIALLHNNPQSIKNIFDNCPNLQWVHNIYIGCDALIAYEPFKKSPIPLTNSKGTASIPLAEFVLTASLHFYKKVKIFEKLKNEGTWAGDLCPEQLSGRTILLVGYGDIGRTIGRMCRTALNMKVLAIKRDLTNASKEVYGEVEQFFPIEELKVVVGKADIIVNALPNTPDTVKTYKEEIFKAMKSHALFINVGRGLTVDENALIKALKEDWIAGAGVDVFEKEPLSKDSPFYTDEHVKEKVLMTCHRADKVPELFEMRAKGFLENLESYRKGGALLTLFDKIKGY